MSIFNYKLIYYYDSIILILIIYNKNMNVLIIYAHPNEESFCSALKQKLVDGLEKNKNIIRIHDLYKVKFNPQISKEEVKGYPESLNENKEIRKYQQDISWANIICIIHPVWWYGPPAIMKGYIEKVITEGFAFIFKDDQSIPKLTDKKLILIQTFDADEQMEIKLNEDITFKAMYNIWSYCGIKECKRVSLYRVSFVPDEQRKKWLEDISTLGKSIK
ncbi:MAG: NAD(P)H-dependent oxidoreductase [Asgard group archaeon]|nr:NAD(P)H-dependent oxidoreductase [Asgard group archaeon]